jgi:hypothetical protein
MGRLRAELTEQLSSEMLVERIVMRTQASRLPADAGRLDGPQRTLEASWADDVPPRELTGGWPAVRLDEPRETQQFDQVRVERTGPHPPVPPAPGSWRTDDQPAAAEARPWDAPLQVPSWETPATSAWPVTPEPAGPPTSTVPAAAPPPAFTPPPAREEPPLRNSVARHEHGPHASRHAADEHAPATSAFPMAPPARAARPAVPPPTTGSPIAPPAPEPFASPLEWLAARALLDPPSEPSPSASPRRRRRDDGPAADAVDPAAAPTAQRPAVPAKPSVRIDDRGSYRVAVRDEPAAQPGPATQENRLADILAENGVSPATGGRRRRRYRDEDDADDVLARILGRN